MASEVSAIPPTASQKQNQSNEVRALLAFKQFSCPPSGQVSALNFTYAGLIGRLHLDDLMVLENLQHLYLSGNSFSSNLFHDKASYPCNIETLGLSFNNLLEPISITFFYSCDRLTSLNVSHNLIPGGSLDFGTSRLELDLSSNLISDSPILNFSSSICQNLRLLNLSHNKLSAELVAFPSCKKLSVLDLSNNILFGDILGLAPLVSELYGSLEFLDISHNNLSGNLSTLEFKNCAKLLVLSLSNNALYGTGIPQNLTNCQLLENLDLSHNELQDKIPADLGNLGNLKYLNLAHNDFSGNIPPELGWTCGNLVELDLSGNKLSGGFPKTFRSCDSLQSLNLGNNQLSGNFLTTVVIALPKLQILQVPFNNIIIGPIPSSLGNMTKLQVLNLNSNAFTGNIPSGLCSSSTSFFSLQNLLLAGNFLSGSVPTDIGNCKNLRTIDFSLNNLSGYIPPDLWMLPHLSDLIIWGNIFSGEIPYDICFRQSNLETLILNNNLFNGTIPKSIGLFKNLVWLSLLFNQLSGEIPTGIGTLQNLSILQLNHNSFTGKILPEIGNCQSLIWLELNNNHFTGSIPFELSSQKGLAFKNDREWKYAYLRSEGKNGCNTVNSLLYSEGIRLQRLVSLSDANSCSVTRAYHGWTTSLFTSNGGVIYFDLSFNILSGSIPDSLSLMFSLQLLNLGHNRLSGTIHDTVGHLKVLEVLDLSHNQLEGRIPASLKFLSFLSEVDFSNNHFSGTIPSTTLLETFPASKFENNSGLCGYPLAPCDSKKSQRKKSHKDNPSVVKEFDWFWPAAWMGFINDVIIGVFAGIIPFEVKNQWFMKTFRITPPRRSKQLKISRQRRPCTR